MRQFWGSEQAGSGSLWPIQSRQPLSQRRNAIAIKGSASVAIKDFETFRNRHRAAIRSFGGQRIKHIRHRQYPRFQAKLIRGQTVRVALTIKAFMMRPGQRRDIGEGVDTG